METTAAEESRFCKNIAYGLSGAIGSWTISRWQQVRLLAVPAIAATAFASSGKEVEEKTKWHPPSTVWLLFAAFFDAVGLSPRFLTFRVSFDALLLLATAVGAGATLSFGLDRVREGDVLSGAICCAIGGAALYQAVSTSMELAKGVSLFQRLDPVQQAGVLKHRALHALSAPKVGRAIVIDGMWDAGPFNRMPMAAVEAVYEKYDVLYYAVRSPKELAALLGKSTAVWGEQADLLIFVGHANPRAMALGGNYYFFGTPLEVEAIQQAVRPAGQVMLLGCNTATGGLSLAMRLAERLQGVEVNGVAAYLNPFITSHSFSPGRFDIRSHFPLALNSFTAPWNTTLSFYSA